MDQMITKLFTYVKSVIYIYIMIILSYNSLTIMTIIIYDILYLVFIIYNLIINYN